MDVAGDNQLNLEHEYTSRDRILPDKSIISDDIIQTIHQDFKPKSDCLSCYGAESETRKCCNTCSELLDAYNDKGWNTFQITKTASVCQHDPSNPNAKYKAGEGCRVAGSIRVNKVSDAVTVLAIKPFDVGVKALEGITNIKPEITRDSNGQQSHRLLYRCGESTGIGRESYNGGIYST
eukprot:gene20675-26805_t